MGGKSFKKDNPALNFISVPTDPEEQIVEEPVKLTGSKKAPEGYKLNPEYVEVKSKRVQLLLQPSVVEKIKALAKKKGLSMNEAINEAIQAYLQNEWED